MLDLTLKDINPEFQSREEIADDIAKRATNFARYAMADVEFAQKILGNRMTHEEYVQVFKAMMKRKAENELRKHKC